MLSTVSFTALCTNLCQNGGTCTAANTCTCDVGWIGMQCETGTHDKQVTVHANTAAAGFLCCNQTQKYWGTIYFIATTITRPHTSSPPVWNIQG